MKPARRARSDRRGDHEAVAAEAGGDVEPVQDRAEQRLVVGGDVVLAADEDRKRDELERRQQLLDGRANGGAPALALPLGIAARAEVAGEDAAVAELLRREAPLGRDDERVE